MHINLSAASIKMEIPSIIAILTVLFISISLSTSSSLDNYAQLKLDLLINKVEGLQTKVDQLSLKLEEEKITRSHYQAFNSQLETRINQLAAENTLQNERLDSLSEEFETKIRLLMTQMSVKQGEEVHRLKENHAPFIPPESSEQSTDDIISESGSSPRLPPSSCRQLSTIGHYLDGIYLVANADTNKIETVYCDFGSSTLSETLFGNVDVKSKSVHFYVQRSSDFNLTNVVLPFDLERLNVGGAMNTAAGVFTAPVDGIYHFEFSGLKDASDSTVIFIQLQLNGVLIGHSYGPPMPNFFLGLSSISASLRLKTGDQVTLFKESGTLNDDAGHWTHFTGWLIEEDWVLG